MSGELCLDELEMKSTCSDYLQGLIYDGWSNEQISTSENEGAEFILLYQ